MALDIVEPAVSLLAAAVQLALRQGDSVKQRAFQTVCVQCLCAPLSVSLYLCICVCLSLSLSLSLAGSCFYSSSYSCSLTLTLALSPSPSFVGVVSCSGVWMCSMRASARTAPQQCRLGGIHLLELSGRVIKRCVPLAAAAFVVPDRMLNLLLQMLSCEVSLRQSLFVSALCLSVTPSRLDAPEHAAMRTQALREPDTIFGNHATGESVVAASSIGSWRLCCAFVF
jgi:hypothetical protein